MSYSHDLEVSNCLQVARALQGRYEESESPYGRYKSKKYEEALDFVSRDEGIDQEVARRLRAQIYFKLGRFKESAAEYEKLVADGGDDEVKSNLVAALSSAHMSEKALSVLQEHGGAQSDTFEFAYNGACAAIEGHNFALAERLLQTARDTAETVLEGADEEELARELTPISLQQGYVAHMQGRLDEAGKLYQETLDRRHGDKGAVAVAASNLVGLQEKHGLFEAVKRLEKARQSEIYETLTPEQRESISFNLAVVLVRLNRAEAADKVLEEVRKEFPASHMAVVLRGVVLVSQGKTAEAQQVLEAAEWSQGVARALAGLYADQNDLSKALEVLTRGKAEAPERDTLQLLVVLARREGGEAGRKALEAALGRATTGSDKGVVLEASAQLNQRAERWQTAAEEWKLLGEVDPSRRVTSLAGYVHCLSHYDSAGADRALASLPAVEGVDQVDVEQLELDLLAQVSTSVESSAFSSSSAVDDSEKTADVDAEESAIGVAADEQQRRRKHRKKKKIKRPPQNMDRPVDEERWLPLKLRSDYVAPIRKQRYNKKKGGRIGGAGGHQGVGAGDESLDAAAKIATAAEAKRAAEEQAAADKAAAAAKKKNNNTGGGKKKKGRR